MANVLRIGKKIVDRRLVIDIATALLVLGAPFILYIHVLFDDTDDPELYGISQSMLLWMILIRGIPVILLVICFFTTKSWWKYALTIPLWLYLYSFIKVLHIIDSEDLIPVLVSVTVIVLIGVDFNLKKKARDIIKSVFPFYSLFRLKALHEFIESHIKPNSSGVDMLARLEHAKSEIECSFEQLQKSKGGKIIKRYNIIFSCLIVIVTPVLFSYHNFVPDDKEYVSIFGFHVGDYGFQNVGIFLWFFGMKATIIFVLCVWYVASERWWRHAILSPIIIFSYQIWEALENSSKMIDEIAYFRALPIILLIVLLLFGLSQLVNYQYRIMELKKEVDHRIDELLLAQVNNDNATIQETKSVLAAIQEDGGCPESQLQDLEAMKEKLLQSLKERKKERG